MKHPKAAAEFLQDEVRTDWHDAALWHVREKRDRAAQAIPEWEDLRTLAGQIKRHTLSRLDEYLLEFEKNAKANGVIVHWAKDAAAHNEIVQGILQKHKIRRIVKSKSMLTEECGLNPHLEKNGFEVTDTDLGEWILQLAHELPSHIVMPAIHKKKEEIGELFHQTVGTEAGATDPQYLVEAARQRLREKFLAAEAAITGVNFGLADTGGVVVCTNEGNADLGVHLAPMQIHCMGIEKLIPRAADLGVFTRLLARSATGQPITIYTSHHHRPKPEGEMHIVIVDNGRTEQLGREDFRDSLACIRCGACMNTCPIYRRSGGHSYAPPHIGPIGAILAPGYDLEAHSSLPFASTLCGSCSDVCPVRIDIHGQLYKWRQQVAAAGLTAGSKARAMRYGGRLLANPARYARATKRMRFLLRTFPGLVGRILMRRWTRARALPTLPPTTFKEWYKNRRSHES